MDFLRLKRLCRLLLSLCLPDERACWRALLFGVSVCAAFSAALVRAILLAPEFTSIGYWEFAAACMSVYAVDDLLSPCC